MTTLSKPWMEGAPVSPGYVVKCGITHLLGDLGGMLGCWSGWI